MPNSDYISLNEFRDFMLEPIVPLSDINDYAGNPISRSLPTWRKFELLPFIPKGSWVKVSFAQLIWIRMVDSLRTLGYPYDSIRNVADYFFKDAYDNDLPKKNLEYNISLLKRKKALKVGWEPADEQSLNEMQAILADKIQLHGLKFDINYLTNIIANTIASGVDQQVLIFSNGEVLEFIYGEYYNHGKKLADFTAPHIRLSIQYYLKEFIDSQELSELVAPQLLNDDELKVLKEMRNRNVKEITIKMNEGSILVQSTRTGKLTNEQVRQIKEILALKNYERLTLDTIDEKSISFKKTNKKV